jgi:hypothetical protein
MGLVIMIPHNHPTPFSPGTVTWRHFIQTKISSSNVLKVLMHGPRIVVMHGKLSNVTKKHCYLHLMPNPRISQFSTLVRNPITLDCITVVHLVGNSMIHSVAPLPCTRLSGPCGIIRGRHPKAISLICQSNL